MQQKPEDDKNEKLQIDWKSIKNYASPRFRIR